MVIKVTKATDEDIRLLRAAKVNYRESLLDKHNVTGIGIGRRKRHGKYEDELVIKVYVKKKLPKYQVAKGNYIPPFLEFENKKFATDVEESEIPEAQLFTLRSRPLIGGSSIGTELWAGGAFLLARTTGSRFTGTLGVCVTLNDDNTYILSNNHVLALCDRLVVGDPVYQPSLGDGGVVATDQVATLSRTIPIDFRDENLVDCALAQVADSFNGANREIHWVGYPKPYFPAPSEELSAIGGTTTGGGGTTSGGSTKSLAYPLGATVWKMGRTTEVTIGVCVGVNEDTRVDYSRLFGNPRGTNRALFVDQIRIMGIVPLPFSQGGDSGSLVLDYSTNQPIGLLFAGTAVTTTGAIPFSFCNPIDTVLNRLGIQHI